MKGYNQTPYRLGRRPGKQGPRPLPGNQGRVEKLATGKTDVMTGTKDTNRGTGVTTIETNDGAQRLQITKDIFTVGTWNVQTLWTTGKLELLRNEMKRFRFDVVGISEVRWTGKGETPRGDFIWSGENTTHTKGVGLLLSTKAKKAMIGYNPISSRLISARFNATPFKITVIHVYAPTSASSEDEIEAFYEKIEKELTRTSKKDLIIITGDWNAKVGSDNTNWENAMGKYGYGDRNERGERLLEFAALHNFYICNTRFQQKPNRKWTWASPNGVHKNMIDLVLIQKRWKSSVVNCRTFQSADISSDHSLVLCNIKLKLKQRHIKPIQNHRFDINQLKNQAIRELYQERLNANLQRIDETDSIDEHAAKIERAIKETLQTTITTMKRAKNPWISEQTLNLADEKRRVKQIKNTSTQNAKLYKDLCNRVRKSARQDKEKWIQDKCDEIEKGLNVGNIRQAYSLIKTLKKKFIPRATAIKNEDGTMAQSKDNVKDRWTQYCSDLYKDEGGGDEIVRELENISPSYQDDSQDILYSEVNQAIQSLKSNKSPGSDEITAEMIQAGGEQLIHQIHALCNKAWNQGAIPKEWGKSILVPIPKKGDLNECSNYRKISLINHTSKILLIILLNRLKYQLDPYLTEEQAGFRKDRDTVQQILTLRLLAEKAKRQGIKIYNCFIDFQKAFDTIKHKIIWAVLKSYGIGNKTLALLQNIYEQAQSAVRVDKEIGEWFHTSVGTRQGDPLSPLLFITYLERVMDKAIQTDSGISISGTLVNNLRFADDINIIQEDRNMLLRQTERLQTVATQAGLTINTGKTKTLVFGGPNIEQPIRIAGNIIENVEQFEYLGSLLTWDNNCAEEIKRIIGKAIGAMASLKHIWKSKKITIKNKIKILTTCVFSVLLYASETWTLKEAERKKLLAFEMKCYRRILRVSWQDMIRNVDIRKQIERQETIIDNIKRRKLRLFGHICRMDDNRLIKQTVFSRMNGKSKRGRPCREWLDDVLEWCGRSGQDLFHLAQDRRQWKNIIRSVVGPNG